GSDGRPSFDPFDRSDDADARTDAPGGRSAEHTEHRDNRAHDPKAAEHARDTRSDPQNAAPPGASRSARDAPRANDHAARRTSAAEARRAHAESRCATAAHHDHEPARAVLRAR